MGIADHDEVTPIAGQGLQQGHLPGVGVLVLVHEHVPVARPELVAVGVRLDRRPADEVGVVRRSLLSRLVR